MNRYFRVIWNSARALVTQHAATFAATRNSTAALVHALEEQEEKNLVWVMQLHSQAGSIHSQRCMPDSKR